LFDFGGEGMIMALRAIDTNTKKIFRDIFQRDNRCQCTKK
jgi:hypothetical protein